MNRQRKVLTALGAIWIVCMLLIAAFALGVYVGEHGWTREGLSLRGPQRPPNQPGPDQVQPPGLPPGAQATRTGLRTTNMSDLSCH